MRNRAANRATPKISGAILSLTTHGEYDGVKRTTGVRIMFNQSQQQEQHQVLRWVQGLVCSALLLLSSYGFAATVIVTQKDDVLANESPIFGSLRDAIKNRASPGDTIVFNVKGPVELQDLLTIPRNLRDITIQGPVTLKPGKGLRGVILIEADNVTMQGMTFAGVSVLVHDTSVGSPRRIQRFSLLNNRFRGDAEVYVAEVDNCVVSDNVLNVDPTSGGAWALHTWRTGNCLVTRNNINSRSEAAYFEQDSHEVTVFDNTIRKGSFRISSISGDIRKNRSNGRMSIDQPDFGATNGLLTVDNNTLASIYAERTYISLINNTLSGASVGSRGPLPALYLDNGDPRGKQGPVLIEHNTITGGLNGIMYHESPSAASAVIHDNTISGCDVRGILVNFGRNVHVIKNTISECGSGTDGRGIAVGTANASGVVIDDNNISAIKGPGILVVPQPGGIDVLVKENTVQDNMAAGVVLQANDTNRQGRINLLDNTITGNAVAGVLAEANSRGSVHGGTISNNSGAGILVQDGARVEIRRVMMGGNAGTGIDLSPSGVTGNAELKAGNGDIDWPDNLSMNPATLKLQGTAAPGSVVEVFVVEAGERLGNPENGEGIDILGMATAAADGSFVFPASGNMQCPETRLLTLTATLGGPAPVTSEFSPDFDCVLPDDPTGGDEDTDGVGDDMDQCPDTPAGESVDADGCAESQKDDDADGVTNDMDQCPATPAGEAADTDGCAESQKDDDADGVTNDMDQCPATPDGEVADADGCAESQKDDDNDSIANSSDQCPDTPAGEIVDPDGCAESQKDDDGDGVTNDADQCLSTAPGEAVDADGCSQGQADDDGDGVVNADDRCPGAGSAATSGCAGEIVIPGLGTAYLNDLASSTISSGVTGESCTNCSIDLVDSTAHFCFAAGGFVITGLTQVQSNDCGYTAPALSIDGTAAAITSTAGEYAVCDGGPSSCEVSADNANLSGRCTTTECVKWFSESLLDGSAVDATKVVVTKTTVGDDGTFMLIGRTSNPQYPYFWNVTTSARVGNKVAELHFGNEAAFIVEESPQPEWIESILCTNSSSGDIVVGQDQAVLTSIASETFTTWQCTFTNTLIADSDGDGVPDNEDRCSSAGTGGNECPQQGDNGEVAHYCNDALNCNFVPTDGYCSDCWIERLDGSGAIYCPAGGVCEMRNSNALQCSSGNCEYFTPNLTGNCGAGAICTLGDAFSCRSDVDGNGCDGTFVSGEVMSCPAQACEINVEPEVILNPSSQTARIDIYKSTEGGDGLFTFPWQFSRDLLWVPLDVASDGEFQIQTLGGVGETLARFYIEPLVGSVNIAEVRNGPFDLDRVDCDSPDGLTIRPESALPPDFGAQIRLDQSNVCTFVGVRAAAQPDRVEPFPPGFVFPDGATNIANSAFGGQLNTANPVVGVGTGDGEIFIDVVTGEVPRAGNDFLSFGGNGFLSFGVLVQPNEDIPGADSVRSFGPSSTTYNFDPASGRFGWGILDFQTIVDLTHLGNDNTSPALLSVNQSSNRIDLVSPPDSTGVSDRNQFTVTQSQHLLNVPGQLVSAQAYELGRLDCYNPCEGNGIPMPAGCSAEIDDVIATPGLEYCSSSWTPSCASVYSGNNNNFCSLPPAERQVSFGGHLLVLTNGAPGQVHLADPALNYFGRVTTVANVGDDPVRLRCLEGVCAVTNNGSDTLTILTWDGGDAATVTETVPVGDGPIGLSLRKIGDSIVILSTGQNDDTYSVTAVSATGQLLSNVTSPILAGCDGPAHIIWVDGSSKAFATCYNNSSYAVFDP
jgi:hypothetical protein